MQLKAFKSSLVSSPDGASINVAEWSGTKGPLVCVHGLTSSSRAFVGLANEMPEYHLLAIDCRGRGRSCSNPPFGLEQHAKDLAATMDATGIKKAILVGHSMGAYVVSAFCELFPERVEKVIFIDGGYFLNIPKDNTQKEFMIEFLGPIMEKMQRTWSSIDEFLEHYASTSLYPNGVDIYGREHLLYELVGAPPNLRSAVSEQAISTDWSDILDQKSVARRLKSIHVPTLVLRAPYGLMGDDSPIISDEILNVIMSAVKDAQSGIISGSNHHTILFSKDGANRVSAEIQKFLDD